MSHASKAKAKGVSASSFFDLKAELSKKEAEFAKSKAAGKNLAIVGGVKRPEKVSLVVHCCSKSKLLFFLVPETNCLGPPKQRR